MEYLARMLIAKPDRPAESLPQLVQDLEARVKQLAETNKDEIIFPGYEQGLARLLLSLGSLVGSVLCWLAFFFWRILTDSEAIRFSFVGVALLLGLYNRIDDRREKKRVKRYNEGARIGLGATVIYSTALNDPRNTATQYGLVLMTLDRELQANPDRLVEMSEHLYALRQGEREPVPEHLNEAVERLHNTDETVQKRIHLPREFTGNDDTWLAVLRFCPEALPRGILDRTLWPVLYHRDDPDVTPMVPDKEIWWSPEVDAFMDVWYDSASETDESAPS
jgi:hypothetical protein